MLIVDTKAFKIEDQNEFEEFNDVLNTIDMIKSLGGTNLFILVVNEENLFPDKD